MGQVEGGGGQNGEKLGWWVDRFSRRWKGSATLVQMNPDPLVWSNTNLCQWHRWHWSKLLHAQMSSYLKETSSSQNSLVEWSEGHTSTAASLRSWGRLGLAVSLLTSALSVCSESLCSIGWSALMSQWAFLQWAGKGATLVAHVGLQCNPKHFYSEVRPMECRACLWWLGADIGGLHHCKTTLGLGC